MTEPTTEAGRWMLDNRKALVTRTDKGLAYDIVSIEVQARQAAEAQTATAVEAGWKYHRAHACGYCGDNMDGSVVLCSFAEVLSDLSAAATKHDEEVAERAVQPWREALEDCVMQFGYRVPGPAINSAGLSALEGAFRVLGWDDPHPLGEDQACDIYGCINPSYSGLRWGDLYLRLCDQHSSDLFAKKARPAVKQHALDREAQRGPDGVLPVRALLTTQEADSAGEGS